MILVPNHHKYQNLTSHRNCGNLRALSKTNRQGQGRNTSEAKVRTQRKSAQAQGGVHCNKEARLARCCKHRKRRRSTQLAGARQLHGRKYVAQHSETTWQTSLTRLPRLAGLANSHPGPYSVLNAELFSGFSCFAAMFVIVARYESSLACIILGMGA